MTKYSPEAGQRQHSQMSSWDFGPERQLTIADNIACRQDTSNNSCLVLALELPDVSGRSPLRQLLEKYKHLPIIAMGEGVAVDMAEQARDAGFLFE